jgi:hypothetical protein
LAPDPESEELAALLPEFEDAAPESLLLELSLLPPSDLDELSALFAASFEPPSFELPAPLEDGALFRPA